MLESILYIFYISTSHYIIISLLYLNYIFCNSLSYIYIYIYTKILEVNLFAFAYRLFHRDFSPNQWDILQYVPLIGKKSL